MYAIVLLFCFLQVKEALCDRLKMEMEKKNREDCRP